MYGMLAPSSWPSGMPSRSTALTASAPRKRPPRYSALRSGVVKTSGCMPDEKSRVAASPKSAAVTSIPSVPMTLEIFATISGEFMWLLLPLIMCSIRNGSSSRSAP